jgi:putative solute:sodium symporter small subunit
MQDRPPRVGGIIFLKSWKIRLWFFGKKQISNRIMGKKQMHSRDLSLSDSRINHYWAANISLLAKLMAIWFIASFGAGIVFVEPLNHVQFFGFKLGFWFSQQGAIYVFLGLVLYYVRRMNRLERQFSKPEKSGPEKSGPDESGSH